MFCCISTLLCKAVSITALLSNGLDGNIFTVEHCCDCMFCAVHCNTKYVSHYCSCMTVCWPRVFIEALIQVMAHSVFTQAHIVQVKCDSAHNSRPTCTMHAGCQCGHEWNLCNMCIYREREVGVYVICMHR